MAKKKHVSVGAEASLLHIAESLAFTCRTCLFLATLPPFFYNKIRSQLVLQRKVGARSSKDLIGPP
jgi:hypothetical protein